MGRKKLAPHTTRHVLPEEVTRLKKVTEKIPALIVVYSIKTGIYLYVNDSVKEILGYKSKDFLEKGLAFVSSLVHPEDMPMIMQKNQEALVVANKNKDFNKIVNFEYRMRHKDGSWRWVLSEGIVFSRDKSGKVENVMNITIDITERKEIEEKAAEKLRFHAGLVGAISDAVIATDSEFKIVSFNKAAEKLYGWEEKEVLGKKANKIIGTKHVSISREDFFKEIEEKGFWKGEVIQKRRDGKELHINASVSYIYGEKKQLVGAIAVNRDITEERKKEQEIRDREELYRLVVEHSKDLIVLLDYKAKVLYSSPSYKTLLGYSEKDFIGKIGFSFIHKKDLFTARKEFAKVLTGKVGRFPNMRVRHKDGNWVLMDTRGEAVLQKGRIPRMIVVTMRDITASQKADDELRRANEQVTNILESISDGFAAIDRKLRYIYVNKKMQQIINKPMEEIIGKELWKVRPNAKVTLYYKKYREMLRTGKPSVFEYTSLTTGRIYRHYAYPSKEGITAYITDITEQKQAEEKILESEERYRTLYETMSQGVLYHDEKGAIISANPAAQEILGVDLVTLHKNTEKHHSSHAINEDGSPLPPQDHPALIAVKTGKKVENKVMGFRNPKKNQTVWINVNSVPQFKTTAQPVGKKEKKPYQVYTTFEDITQRKMLERQKDEFIGIASHELKTPVTSLKAYTQVLETRFSKAGDEKSALLLKKMDTQLNKLTNLIGDLLDVTKIETGKLQFTQAYFDMNELVGEVVEEMQRTTERHKLVTYLSRSKALYGDRDRIGQVLVNLISNAIKYSPQANEIIIKTTPTRHAMSLSVRDFGVGIPKKMQSHIFERFVRVPGEKRESYPGLGLGLYISKEIIRRHGGEIWVESNKGRGSTFYFSVPVVKDSGLVSLSGRSQKGIHPKSISLK